MFIFINFALNSLANILNVRLAIGRTNHRNYFHTSPKKKDKVTCQKLCFISLPLIYIQSLPENLPCHLRVLSSDRMDLNRHGHRLYLNRKSKNTGLQSRSGNTESSDQINRRGTVFLCDFASVDRAFANLRSPAASMPSAFPSCSCLPLIRPCSYIIHVRL